MGKTKDLSVFERCMVIGARCTGLSVLRTATIPVCIKNGPLPKGHPANLTQLWEALESTWTSIPVEHFRPLVESMPRGIEAVLRAKGEVRKLFPMFDILCV